MTTRNKYFSMLLSILLFAIVSISRMVVVDSFGILQPLLQHQTNTNQWFGGTIFRHPTKHPLSALFVSSSDMEQKLLDIGRRLKLEVLDLDEGIYGYDSQDNKFGLKVIHSTIDVPDDVGESLGIQLTELASSTSRDGRGLVLVSDVFGAAAEASTDTLQPGDVLTGVKVEGMDYSERLTGLDYDLTVLAIGRAKEVAYSCNGNTGGGAGDILTIPPAQLTFEANRLVERAPISVNVVDAEDPSTVRCIDTLAGENLRKLLQRKGIHVYSRKTKRFDQPFSTGDCGGEGICGTCLVKVLEGMDVLSPKDDLESLITKGRPLSWRASCRCVVGHDNQKGKLTIQTQPQNSSEDEINAGVRSIM